VEGGEEAGEAVRRGGGRVGGFGVEEPLEDGDAYGAVKAAWAEAEALPDVLQE
jgi:hypothetical protein